MELAEEQLNALLDLCDEVSVLKDGTSVFVHMKNLRYTCGGTPLTMNALLSPQEHSGYATRLFFERKHDFALADGNPPNWQVQVVLGTTWHTWSWKDVPANQELIGIVAGHLKAFKP